MKTRTSVSRTPGKSLNKGKVTEDIHDSALTNLPLTTDIVKTSVRLKSGKNKKNAPRQGVPDSLVVASTESESVGVILAYDNLTTSGQTIISTPKKVDGQKGRNLDQVVRRMLRAKKANKGPLVSSDGRQLKSVLVDTETHIKNPRAEYPVGVPEDICVASNQIDCRVTDSIVTEKMIDVQLSSDSHLTKVIGVKSPESHLNISGPKLSNETRIPTGLSPNAMSDNRASCFRPLIPPMPSLGTDHNREEIKTISLITKQEYIASTCEKANNQNGSAQIHSPSSCKSQQSPERRTPSPRSPIARDGVTSLTESSVNQAMLHVSPNAGAAIVRASSSHSKVTPYISDSLKFVQSSSNTLSPCAITAGSQFCYENGDIGITEAAMSASGIGLPTLVPSLSAFGTSQQLFRIDPELDRCEFSAGRTGSEPSGIKLSPNAPNGRNPPRGIVGHKQAAAANESRGRRGSGSVDEKCPYKRPPHTYPALIASAILDSPGNLITLRGIYDYIMNNFPYYKFGHDKSAWQNSIRHNLSLNQCFVKVPRYENAAKSNYWTMTREGFEEFGNENSFKRRRRRGAALAPISAYKNKKPTSSEGHKGSKLRASVTVCNEARAIGPSAASWSRPTGTPESGEDYNQDSQAILKTTKRVGSPGIRPEDGKHPRMMVLRHGDGPTIEGLGRQSDRPRRPNSLSSVEEMQGNVNSFSKTLSTTGDHSLSDSFFRRNQAHSNTEILTQQWMMAAMQKNLNLFPSGILPNLTPSPPLPNSFQGNTSGIQAKTFHEHPADNIRTSVISDGIEIGYQIPSYPGSTGLKMKLSNCCKFCEFSCADDSSTLLEQHCHMAHPLEITNAKATAIASIVVAGCGKDSENRIKTSLCDETSISNSFPSIVSGVSSTMLAVAASYNNAQNFLAAAQAAGLGFPMSSSYPSNIAAPNVLTASMPQVASLSEVLSQNIAPGRNNLSDETENTQSHLPGAVKLSQDHLRQIVYQQLITQNPFFTGSSKLATSIPRPPPSSQNEMTQLAHLRQYQQKVLEMAVQNVQGNSRKITEAIQKKATASQVQKESHIWQYQGSPSSICSQQNEAHSDVEVEKRQDAIHEWKQCHDCDFTAKGSHGLELHQRKVHGSHTTEEEPGAIRIRSRHEVKKENSDTDGNALEQKTHDDIYKLQHKALSSNNHLHRKDCSTQTIDSGENRTCKYCDVTFGDDTMYALHMTCHDYGKPFKCNICEKDCHEKYYFNVHLLRGLHHPTNISEKNERSRSRSTENFRDAATT